MSNQSHLNLATRELAEALHKPIIRTFYDKYWYIKICWKGLASLKFEIDKLDIDKLAKVPTDLNSLKIKVDKLDVKVIPDSVDLGKLSDVVKTDVVKKDKYDELIKKVDAIKATDTSNLLKKTDYDTKISETEKNYWSCHNLQHKNLKVNFRKFCSEISTSKINT